MLGDKNSQSDGKMKILIYKLRNIQPVFGTFLDPDLMRDWFLKYVCFTCRSQQERQKICQEFESQIDVIENQLSFERSKDTKSKWSSCSYWNKNTPVDSAVWLIVTWLQDLHYEFQESLKFLLITELLEIFKSTLTPMKKFVFIFDHILSTPMVMLFIKTVPLKWSSGFDFRL